MTQATTPKESSPEVMTLRQTAEYLQLAERSVLKMAQEGTIPAAKIASQWRFLRSLVNDWLASQMQHQPQRLSGKIETHRDPVEAKCLTDMLYADWMILDLAPGSKQEILESMVSRLESIGAVSDGSEFLERLLAREELYSTALGNGIAIPHPRQPAPELLASGPGVALGRCPNGTDFDSLDGQPTFLLFLVCVPNEELHLRIMSRIARLVSEKEVVEKLIASSDPNQVIETVGRIEADLTKNYKERKT